MAKERGVSAKFQVSGILVGISLVEVYERIW